MQRAAAALAATAFGVGPAWADHPVGLRTAGWSPVTAALVFGGLALLAGMLVVVIVALLSRRDPSEPPSGPPDA